MKLNEYAIDDLHVMATAELERNPDAVAKLHALYVQLREKYIAESVAMRQRVS